MASKKIKRNLLQRIQDFMGTPNGQIVMNYAYNWGASVVILGTLFKLVHLPGANIMLCVGMGTEVFIFFLSAFDLSAVKHSQENITPTVNTGNLVTNIEPAKSNLEQSNMSEVISKDVVIDATSQVSMLPQTEQQTLKMPIGVSKDMEEATTAYIEQLKNMTDILSRCSVQATSLAGDANQMNTLSKNLAGINAIYEMQLRSVSTQIGTIDQVHEETRRMAKQIEELNEVYARMLQAMTASTK